MANGDLAAGAGMDVVPATDDIRQSYDEINKTRDYIAVNAITNTRGQFTVPRIEAGDQHSARAHFPTNLFAQPPITLPNVTDSRLTISVRDVTTTGATITLVNRTNAASPAGTQCSWIAIGV